MSSTPIRAVLFDMGGTLEDVYYDDELRLQATPGLLDILRQHGLDPGLSVPDLCAVVKAGMHRYGEWRQATEQELPPERSWSEFVLPDLPRDRLEAAAEEIAFYYDTHFYDRRLRPEVPSLLSALRQKGLRMAVISNIYSRGQVPYNLERYGIRHFFQTIVMSSCFGWRKPNPRIFLQATRLLELPPAACAYVGDTVSRDVVGARRAGYGLAIQIKSFLTTKSDRATDVEPPDAVVQDLREVIALVERNSRKGH